MAKSPIKRRSKADKDYESILGDVSDVIQTARQSTARAVNAVMTAAYWLIGRRIVEQEQRGRKRASYGEELIQQLAKDLTDRFGSR